MRIIKPVVVIEDDVEALGDEMLKKIEKFTRKCYKSEDKMTEDSHKEFVARIFQTRKHRGIIEHRTVSVTFVTDRGVSHEAVRHRMASYLQESTRYCDYAVDGKHKGVTYVLPPWLQVDTPAFKLFRDYVKENEIRYDKARELGWKPEQARGFLSHFLKTEFTMTTNLRSWHNVFSLRTAAAAHPSIRQIMIPTFFEFRRCLPGIFDDIPTPSYDFELAAIVDDPKEAEEVWLG